MLIGSVSCPIFCWISGQRPGQRLDLLDLSFVDPGGSHDHCSPHPALFCAVASIFLQLYLYPAFHISFARSLFKLFSSSVAIHWSACFAVRSSHLLGMCPCLYSSYLLQRLPGSVINFLLSTLFNVLALLHGVQKLVLWNDKPDLIGLAFLVFIPKGVTSFPDRGSYEYDQIRVSLCLLCLVV